MFGTSADRFDSVIIYMRFFLLLFIWQLGDRGCAAHTAYLQLFDRPVLCVCGILHRPEIPHHTFDSLSRLISVIFREDKFAYQMIGAGWLMGHSTCRIMHAMHLYIYFCIAAIVCKAYVLLMHSIVFIKQKSIINVRALSLFIFGGTWQTYQWCCGVWLDKCCAEWMKDTWNICDFLFSFQHLLLVINIAINRFNLQSLVYLCVCVCRRQCCASKIVAYAHVRRTPYTFNCIAK